MTKSKIKVTELRDQIKAQSILGRITLRQIAAGWRQFLSVILIAGLALCLYCGLTSNYIQFEARIDKYYKDTNLADVWVTTTGLDDDDITFLKEVDGVLEADSRIYMEGTLSGRNTKVYIDENPTISMPIIKTGEVGVLVDSAYAEDEKTKLNIGDEVELELSNDKFKMIAGDSDLILKFVVTGTMYYPENVQDASYNSCALYITNTAFNSSIQKAVEEQLPNIDPGMVGVVVNTFMQSYMGNFENGTQYLIKTENPEKVQADVESYYQNKKTYLDSDDDFNFVVSQTRETQADCVLIASDKIQTRALVAVFPIIFFAVSVLVILSTISQLILRERTQIGTMKALGIKDSSIMYHYLSFSMSLCAIGGIIGMIAGPIILPRIMNIKFQMLYNLPEYNHFILPWKEFGLAFLVLMTVASVVAFLVCLKQIKQKPSECMRPAIPKKNTKGLVERSKLFENKAPISIKMAVRNISAKKIRAVMVVIGVMGCVALLVCGFGIKDTIDNSINTELYKLFNYDIMTTYTETYDKYDKLVEGGGVVEKKTDFEYAVDAMVETGEIQSYEKAKQYPINIITNKTTKQTLMQVIRPNSNFTTIQLEEGEVALSKDIASDLGVKEGDTVKVVVNSAEYNFKITKLITTSYTRGIFITEDLNYSNIYSSIMFIEAENVNEEMVDRLNEINGTDAAYSIDGLIEQVYQKVGGLDIMTATLKIFALMLAVVVLYNLAHLNMKERARDIATLKVLGFKNSEIGMSLWLEMMILTTVGTILGLALGFPMLYWVLSVNRVEVLTFLYYIKPMSYIASALICMLTAFAINFIMSLMIGKVKMVESLKSIE